jgi:hypothetical protein
MDFWTFYGVVLPATIVVLAYIAMRLHEWDLDRKLRERRRQHPGE